MSDRHVRIPGALPPPAAPREPPVVQAPVRIGRRTKELVKQLLPGEIAVIDHADLDRVAAEGLVEADVAAVLNAAPSMTGRYPNYGPLLVVAAGTVLVDDLGPTLLPALEDGDIVTIVDNQVWRGGEHVCSGRRREVGQLEEDIEAARHALGSELEQFATNTLQYLKREHHLVTDTPDLPSVKVSFKGRHALVVVRGYDYREDLAALKQSGYLREVKPVTIGVDGGADALMELGLKPDVIMGDFDSVSEAALRSGAELIVHAYLGGKAPGADRLEALGLPFEQFETAGTSEDIAMLLAHEMGADLIVAVGTHTSMEEFLDKGRAGMASTFLVRLRVGSSLVDAKGVSRLYRPVVKTRDIATLIFGALAALLAVTLVNEPLRLWVRSIWTYLRSGLGR
jgi:uncharacterized membrane-anchored protein